MNFLGGGGKAARRGEHRVDTRLDGAEVTRRVVLPKRADFVEVVILERIRKVGFTYSRA
jgi:hypothetical protein